MKTTADFLDEIKEKHGLTSDYQLSKYLEVTRGGISSYRTGRTHFDGEMAIKVAKALEVNPAYVMACMEAERAKNKDVRQVWEKAAQVLGGIAAGVVILTNPVMGFDAETASLLTLAAEAGVLCILC